MPSSSDVILFSRRGTLRLLFGGFIDMIIHVVGLITGHVITLSLQPLSFLSLEGSVGEKVRGWGWQVSQRSSPRISYLLFLISSPRLKPSGNPLKSHFTSIMKSYLSLGEFQGFSKLPVKNQEQRLDLFIFCHTITILHPSPPHPTPIELSGQVCRKLINHKCQGLFLYSRFYAIYLYLYPYTSTTLSLLR